jgi:hypothetical protein
MRHDITIVQGHVTGNDWQEIREKKTGKDMQLPRVRFPPRLCTLFHFKIENNRKLYSWPVANNFFISTILSFYQSGYTCIPYKKNKLYKGTGSPDRLGFC